jgi:hypothetical protein
LFPFVLLFTHFQVISFILLIKCSVRSISGMKNLDDVGLFYIIFHACYTQAGGVEF